MIILVLVLSDFGFCNKSVGSMIQWCINNIKRLTCRELVRKSEQIFLVYRNQKIWVCRAVLKSQGTNDWKYNHKYNKAFLKNKKGECIWFTCRYMILFCTRSDSSLASFSLQSPAPSAWLRWYRSVMMDLKII